MSATVSFDFPDQIVVITGATGGVGRACALAFASAGADLMLADIPGSPLAAVAEEVRALGRRAETLEVDVREEEQVQHLADRVVGAYGRVNVLVNTAGVIKRQPSLEYSLADWDWVVDVSLKGTWLCCQKIGALMARQGSGAIVNFSSGAGFRGLKGYPAYGPAKAGVASLTRNLAVEWGRLGIQVNALAPGFLRTNLNAEILADDERTEAWVASTPVSPTVMEPDDVVPSIMFLCSTGARWITGITLPIDGGRHAL
jgi:NAD(P)-dependent dehydrogenase (short-subunit alcohol dehydrogenase family)